MYADNKILVLRKVWRDQRVIRNRKSKKDRQKYKKTNNDIHNITQKTYDRVTLTPQKREIVKAVALDGLAVPTPHVAPDYCWYNLSYHKDGLLNCHVLRIMLNKIHIIKHVSLLLATMLKTCAQIVIMQYHTILSENNQTRIVQQMNALQQCAWFYMKQC